MRILLLDGGLGTTLEAPPYHCTFTSDTPLWSAHLLVADPAILRAVHASFVASGADIILTATYQTSVEGFARTSPGYGPDDAARYMRSAVTLARNASGQRPVHIALSLGPYGATMTPIAAEYSGLYPDAMNSEAALRNWHAQRLKIFTDDENSWNNVQYVAFETLRRADEVRAIRGAMADVASGKPTEKQKPWWITGVFPADEPDEDDIRSWVRAAVGGVEEGLPRPWGIGVNCTRLDQIRRIVSVMQLEVAQMATAGGTFVDQWHSQSGRPWLVLYPDGTQGERYDPATKAWIAPGSESDNESVARPWSEQFRDVVHDLMDTHWEGLIIGGCCRTGPRQIGELRAVVDGKLAGKF
ncbi:putative homocysteine S-methyltransferase [Aspergillus taichungensis]|uniref:Putative homocysteine S-methyltransferase n=1 Tax=Aspergillus taichungensis TaxID=482145 RepID=A0A2J5I6N9_9EURO|nr:putative homocysteine S-methyltransferase [Aspergillus taichungensis]